MKHFALRMFSIVLLAMALATSCSKQETGPAPGPVAEIPKDGVSGVPAPVVRDADMAAVDNPISGAVKEVKAKVLDKAADDKAKGLIHLKILDLEGPADVTENTRFELWKPGSDTEELKPEMNVWSNSEQAVPAGTFDIRLHYEEGGLSKAEGWIRKVTFTPGKLWKAEVVLAAPMQYVRLFGTLGGKDVADNMHVDYFKAGTDQEEFPPAGSIWSTQKLAVAAGSYDLRLAYSKDNVKATLAVKNFVVGGDHGILKKTFALTKQ